MVSAVNKLRIIIVMDACPDCGAPTVGTCEACNGPICMECYRHYEWKMASDICWKCKNKEDLAWLDNILSKDTGTSGDSE